MFQESDIFLPKLVTVAQKACQKQGPAHDFLHVRRVASLAHQIARAENGILEVVVPAALLHELFNYSKDHTHTKQSGEICAEHAYNALISINYPEKFIVPICECIRVHAFSQKIEPDTIEGKILQDADRLDAIGAIGIARCFATCSELQRPFYALQDPFCQKRSPDDRQNGVDHFFTKLLKIPSTLHTKTAKQLAKKRLQFLESFLDQLATEITEVSDLNFL